MTKTETTGHRDQWMSEKHHTWGDNCPMADIDFLCLEYYHLRVVAVIDYTAETKFTGAHCRDSANMQATARFCTDAGRPLFVVNYRKEPPAFYVRPMNKIADGLMPAQPNLDERAFVTWLYKLRGQELPDWLANRLTVPAAPTSTPSPADRAPTA